MVESLNTDEITPRERVTADQEVWMKDRIHTAIEMGIQIEKQRSVGADERQVEDAIDGIVNGTAVEILNHLNLETEGANLRLRHRRDNHLQYTEADE